MKRRGLSTLTKTMTNYFDLQYYASLYIGTGEQMLTLIYDTGSSYLWVPLDNCTCSYATNKYTINSDTTTGGRDSITYALGSTNGVIMTDVVRAVPSSEQETSVSMTILGVDATADLSGTKADGIMGMSPVVNPSYPDELYVQKLYEAGRISKNEFGVSYKYTTEDSKITIGGFDTSIVADESLFKFVNLHSYGHWSLEIINTWYGNEEIFLSSVTGILDTGTSLTYFPTNDFNIIWAKISAGKS